MYILCTWNKSLGDTVNDDKMLGDVTNVYKVRFRLGECVEAMDNRLWLCVRYGNTQLDQSLVQLVCTVYTVWLQLHTLCTGVPLLASKKCCKLD